VVIAAKESGISQGFPPGRQKTEGVLKRSLFKTVLAPRNYCVEAKNNVKRLLIRHRNFRIAAGHKLK
jgi:hypothetical protein